MSYVIKKARGRKGKIYLIADDKETRGQSGQRRFI